MPHLLLLHQGDPRSEGNLLAGNAMGMRDNIKGTEGARETYIGAHNQSTEGSDATVKLCRAEPFYELGGLSCSGSSSNRLF